MPVNPDIPWVKGARGEKHFLGFLPSSQQWIQSLKSYTESGYPLLDRKDREPFDIWPDEICVKDQDGHGACAGYAQTLGIECARWMKGEPYVELSGDFAYAYCKVAPDNGSSPEQICRFLEANGAAPQSLVTKWDINKAHHTPEAKQAALRFRFQRGVKLTELDEIASAVARRVPISITVTAHDGMDHFDKNGIAPNGRDANNHAVLAWGGLKVVGGDEAVKIPNSWSVEWGLEGFMWMKIKDLINRPYFESNTIELAIDDPDNPMDLQT